VGVVQVEKVNDQIWVRVGESICRDDILILSERFGGDGKRRWMCCDCNDGVGSKEMVVGHSKDVVQ